MMTISVEWGCWAVAKINRVTGYKRCTGRTSVHLCPSSLQNLAVQKDFYYPIIVVSLWRILLTSFSMVWDWRVSRTKPMHFIGRSCSIPTIVFYYFSLSLLSIYRLVLWGWVFGLIGCMSLSLSLSLPTFYNNNINKQECTHRPF